MARRKTIPLVWNAEVEKILEARARTNAAVDEYRQADSAMVPWTGKPTARYTRASNRMSDARAVEAKLTQRVWTRVGHKTALTHDDVLALALSAANGHTTAQRHLAMLILEIAGVCPRNSFEHTHRGLS